MGARPWFFTIAPLIAMGVLIAFYLDRPWTLPRALGLALAITGFGLLTLARLQLGDAFSIVPRATKLVTTGLYSRIRHPIYLFSALGIAGTILWVDLPPLLALLLVLVPVQFWRARKEEQALEAKLGDEYRRYRERTWF